MKMEYRQALLVGAFTASLAVPAWAAEKPDSGESMQNEPVVVEEVAPAPMPETKPRVSESQTTFASPEVLRLYNYSPEELVDREVIGSDGSRLGQVSEIVSGRASGRIYAVITRGGFLGLGASDYAVQLDEMWIDRSGLHMGLTETELEMRRVYEKDRYATVEPSDHPISEFSAFETLPQ